MFFFESGDTEVFKADRSKLFASNKRQIDNHTLMLDMLYSYISVVCTYHCRGVFKKVFFCYTRQPSGWKSRRPQNDVYLAFVLNAIIYSSSTLHIYNWLHDVFNPLHSNIRMHILQTVLYISLCAGKENLFNNQEVLQFIIISFILLTLMCDSRVLNGEIRC